MELFKIENFEKEYIDKKFPFHRLLNEGELKKVQDKLRLKLSLAADSSLLTIANELSSRSNIVPNIDVRDSKFNFSQLLSSLNIEPSGSICVNWYRYDDIDSMELTDFCLYFDDIWYEGTDDIEVFDNSFSWFISVRHDGVSSVLRLSE